MGGNETSSAPTGLRPEGAWLRLSIVMSLSLAIGETGSKILALALSGILPDSVIKSVITPILLALVLFVVAARGRTNPFAVTTADLRWRGRVAGCGAGLFCLAAAGAAAYTEIVGPTEASVLWTEEKTPVHCAPGKQGASVRVRLPRRALQTLVAFRWCFDGALSEPSVTAEGATPLGTEIDSNMRDCVLIRLRQPTQASYRFFNCWDGEAKGLHFEGATVNGTAMQLRRGEDLQWYEQFLLR